MMIPFPVMSSASLLGQQDEALATPKRITNKTKLPDDFIPGEYTVICGRGKLCSASPGNKHLRLIMKGYLDSYSTAKNKAEKSAIVSAIIDRVRKASPEGAFVKEENEGLWWEVGDAFAREKVGCIFRDMLHTKYRSSTKSKQARKKQEGAIRSRSLRPSPGIVAAEHEEQGKGFFSTKQPQAQIIPGGPPRRPPEILNRKSFGMNLGSAMMDHNESLLWKGFPSSRGITGTNTSSCCKNGLGTNMDQSILAQPPHSFTEDSSMDPLPLTTIPFSNYHEDVGYPQNAPSRCGSTDVRCQQYNQPGASTANMMPSSSTADEVLAGFTIAKLCQPRGNINARSQFAVDSTNDKIRCIAPGTKSCTKTNDEVQHPLSSHHQHQASSSNRKDTALAVLQDALGVVLGSGFPRSDDKENAQEEEFPENLDDIFDVDNMQEGLSPHH